MIKTRNTIINPTDFWDMTKCTLPGGYQCFKATHYLVRMWLVMKWPISTIPGKERTNMDQQSWKLGESTNEHEEE
jgi:hypothetical protein